MANPSSPPPRPSPPDPLVGRLLAGRYRLISRIASGGMAQVWEATDEVLARRVAVKILHPHLSADTSFLKRFRAEAVSAARLSHPSIVSIYDTFSDGGLEAIVMELVHGVTLRERLDGHGPLDAHEVISIGSQVAEALGIAHRNGLVHRDVKPANILLSNDGRVLVADFGIAKAIEVADLTSEGLILGTAKYVAPEQVEGGPVDARTDLYSLGVVLYEAVCGRPPFQGDGETATALARLHQSPLRPRQVRAGVPRPLESALMRALAREPDQRFPDAASMRQALLDADEVRASLDGATATATRNGGDPPVVRTDEVPSFARSERSWLVPTALVALVAVAVGLAGVLLGTTNAGRGLFARVRAAAGAAPPVKARPLRLLSAEAFDPFGDNHRENDEQAVRAIDGDPASAWSTERYADRGLAKPGVGLVVSLRQPANLQQLVVSSPSVGWTASIYVTDGAPPDRLDAWGTADIEGRDLPAGTSTFQLAGRRGDALLIWITYLGVGGRTTLADVQLKGTS